MRGVFVRVVLSMSSSSRRLDHREPLRRNSRLPHAPDPLFVGRKKRSGPFEADRRRYDPDSRMDRPGPLPKYYGAHGFPAPGERWDISLSLPHLDREDGGMMAKIEVDPAAN